MGAGWMSGLLGKQKVRGEVVDGRLGTFVAPVVELEADRAADLDWVRTRNAKVRDSLKGSASLIERFNNDPNEPEPERLPERVVKGEAFMVKLLEQRMRRNQEE